MPRSSCVSTAYVCGHQLVDQDACAVSAADLEDVFAEDLHGLDFVPEAELGELDVFALLDLALQHGAGHDRAFAFDGEAVVDHEEEGLAVVSVGDLGCADDGVHESLDESASQPRLRAVLCRFVGRDRVELDLLLQLREARLAEGLGEAC